MSAAAPRVASRIDLWPLARLREFHHNPREHTDEQVRAIADSIEEFGFTNPLLVDERRREILAGHARFRAARLLGLAKVPVIKLGYLSPAQQRAYVIADNRLAERASWSTAYLAELAQELVREGYPLEHTGFSEKELQQVMAEAAAAGLPQEEAPPPARPAAPAARRGDLWVLGEHRAGCGDATSIDDLAGLLAGEKADAAWTDPPYNVAYDPAAKLPAARRPLKRAIANDALTPQQFAEFLSRALVALFAGLKEGAPLYVAHPETGGLLFRQCFEAAGFRLASCLIWRKNALVLSRGDYHFIHEPVLYGWKPGTGHRWYGGRRRVSVLEFDEPPFQQTGEDEWQIRVGDETLLVRGRGLTVESARGTVLSEPRPARSREHPTMKPPALVRRMLANSARAGAAVLDPFAGSGSTLVACQQLRMRARLLELDPGYVDVAVRRWEALAGASARLERAGDGRAGLAGLSFAEVARRRRRRS